jgi:hypothetical protein
VKLKNEVRKVRKEKVGVFRDAQYFNIYKILYEKLQIRKINETSPQMDDITPKVDDVSP